MASKKLRPGEVQPGGMFGAQRLRRLYPGLDRFERRHYGGLAASLILHFFVLMGLWWNERTPRPPRLSSIEVEIIPAEPVKVASKSTPSRTGKPSTREAKSPTPKKTREAKTRLEKTQIEERTPPEEQANLPQAREYDMATTVVQAGRKGVRATAKARAKAGKIALPDVSRPVAISSRATPKAPASPQSGEGLQLAQQRGTLKPRLSSSGQQASSRVQLPSRAGVESENGPKLIASNAPAAQTLAPEYRHSSRPGGQFSSQGGAAQPALGGGPASESSQAHSLQNSSLMGSRAGRPDALKGASSTQSLTRGARVSTGDTASTGMAAPSATEIRSSGGQLARADAAPGSQTQANRAAGRAPAASAPGNNAVGNIARAAGTSSQSPTEIQSSGGQRQVAAAGAPINPLRIDSSGGTQGKGAAGAGDERTTGADMSGPGGRGVAGAGTGEGAAGGLMRAGASGRSAAPGAARGMSASIEPEGAAGGTARLADASASAPMQQVLSQGTAHAMDERYLAPEMKVVSPKSVCELPLMMAGFDRKPLPKDLPSIMGSESAMVMETAPVLLPGNMQPAYPAGAVFSRAAGKAVVRAQVLPSGKIGEAFIRQSTGNQILDQAALTTVRAWTFKPARRNGQPVQAWVNVPIEYRNPS